MSYLIRKVLITAFSAASFFTVLAQRPDRAAIEHELAVTAYNYAVGCEIRENYEEALIGLSHIPTGQLNKQQQAWADSLRIKCEAMTGHPMAGNEIPLRQSELLSLDDQSNLFLQGVHHYDAGDYMQAGRCFNDIIEMGVGPRPQVLIEAYFWRGQCFYQLKQWEDCCKDLIRFNDYKTADTDPTLCAMAYYTMGYSRMQQRMWHHARINFSRYVDNEHDKTATTFPDGLQRLQECKNLEAGKAGASFAPLQMAKIEPTTGEIILVESQKMQQDTQIFREKQASATAVTTWRNWHAPYIEE